ncbi:MAG TPA: hypothetical protein PLN61_03525 [bacterium]|nr:hypothetical protein [bacterium]HQI47710.1 hypothetical protein [bacterium]HQJ63483.1 hypothetical protein [bacterium]
MKKYLPFLLLPILPFGLRAGEADRLPLQQIRPAYTVPQGHLYLQLPVRFFFQDQIQELAPHLLTGETYWDIQNSLSLVYGLRDRIDLSLQQVIYQDNHKPGRGYNLPDDLFLRARFAGFGAVDAPLRWGGQIELRLPLAEYHNLPLEPYSAGRASLGLTLLLSRLGDVDHPGAGRTLSANLGFCFHDDHGLVLTTTPEDTLTSSRNSSEFLFGCAATQRWGRFDLLAEIQGRAFMRRPAATAYTRENFIYLSPGFSYTLPSTVQVHFAADLRLTGDVDKTRYLGGSAQPWQTLPNVPQWRVTAGLTIPLIPFPDLHPGRAKSAPGDVSQEELAQELYRQLAAERQKAEQSEQNLERIRSERERISKLLENLRGTLENRRPLPADSTAAPVASPPPSTPRP